MATSGIGVRLNPEDWERVKSLFAAAMELPEDERAEFVDRNCADNPEVRAETLRLLNERSSMDTTFLNPPERESLLDAAARALAGADGGGYEGQMVGGRYFVEREIGRGGNGVVYLAQDRQLHLRPVVVKFLNMAWEGHERARLKFRQEIEALSRLNDPAVVGVLDAGQSADGRLYLVMEYVEGFTLRSRLGDGPLPFDEIQYIVGTICDALQAAHDAGICHRDLKPENIMLPPEGKRGTGAKLIDFGVAKVWNSGYDSKTDTITVIGTVRYVAPEQLVGRAEVRSDIYALGVVCYEMLTGRAPFDPSTPFQLYEMQKAGRITPPSKLRQDVPRTASRAILRALSFRPEDRQASAREFAQEFQAGSKRRFSPAGAAFRVWFVAALLLLLIAAGGWTLLNRGWGSYDSVIEFSGGRDPEEFGFHPRLDLVERAVYNQERTGFDSIRLITNDQGFYYHKLTHAQVYAAMRKGWTLEATMQAVEGGGAAGIDLTPAGGRYGIGILISPSHRQVVQLTTTIEKGVDGPSYEVSGPEDAWHDYQLIFDPRTQTARLQVDGVERLRDYRGHHEYQEGWGLMLGTALYKSSRAETMFKRVRFEINQ